jgi:hypothetical protein
MQIGEGCRRRCHDLNGRNRCFGPIPAVEARHQLIEVDTFAVHRIGRIRLNPYGSASPSVMTSGAGPTLGLGSQQQDRASTAGSTPISSFLPHKREFGSELLRQSSPHVPAARQFLGICTMACQKRRVVGRWIRIRIRTRPLRGRRQPYSPHAGKTMIAARSDSIACGARVQARRKMSTRIGASRRRAGGRRSLAVRWLC